jgi:uridine kinase
MSDIQLPNFDKGLDLVLKTLHREMQPSNDPMNRNHEPIFVAIAGGSCAGKTTFARRLRQGIETTYGFSSPIIGMDNFFRDIDDKLLPRTKDGNPIYDQPNSYHIDELRFSLYRLILGRDAFMPKYDLPTNRRTAEGDIIQPASIIILDGLFAIWMIQRINARNVSIFIEASYDIRKSRRLVRDAWAFDGEMLAWIFDNLVEPNHVEYVAPQAEHAQFVISGQ